MTTAPHTECPSSSRGPASTVMVFWAVMLAKLLPPKEAGYKVFMQLLLCSYPSSLVAIKAVASSLLSLVKWGLYSGAFKI